MQWEPDEEGEIQEEERRHGGRASHIKQHRWKGLPLDEEDDFAKRLGPRFRSDLRDRAVERTNASLFADAPRRTFIEETSKSSRSNDVVKVNPRCCGFPCNSNYNDSQKSYRFAIGSKEPPTRSFKTKEPKSFGAVLTRNFFRPKNNVLHPPWENEWTFLRGQLENEMKQMREMRVSVQEICQDLKRMGSHKEDTSGISSRRRSVSEAVSSRVDELGQSRGHGAYNFSQILENGDHQPIRRAKSAPRTRVNWDSDLPEENSEYARAPTAALFKEIVREKRLYLRNFVAALIKYEESRSLTDAFEFEQNSNSLRHVVARLLPRVNFANDGHLKYGIEAWLSRVVFEELEKSEERDRGSRARRHAWEEYQRLSLLCPIDAIYHGEDHCKNFHEFCNLKFNTIRNELKWLEDWPDDLVTNLLETAKHVWLAKTLANAFDPVATHFSVKSSAKFDARLMEPLGTPIFFQTDSLLPSTTQENEEENFFGERASRRRSRPGCLRALQKEMINLFVQAFESYLVYSFSVILWCIPSFC